MNEEKTTIIDISLELKEGMLVYPDNPPFTAEAASEEGRSLVSKITMGTHTGTHIDVPKHVSPEGMSVGDIPLETFVGPCRVLDCTHAEEMIQITDLEGKDIQTGERLLLKTQNSLKGYEAFRDDYVALSGDAAEWLRDKKVKLVGIDYLSIKQKDNPDYRAHDALLGSGIMIIEGLDLSGAEEGEYTLAALPLKLQAFDGAPVRAVLMN